MLTPLPAPFGLVALVVLLGGLVMLAALGGALLSSGWRGRPTGTAPTCTRCGFDLRSSSASMPADCPECGGALAGRIEIGPRRRRPGRLLAGAAAIGISATGIIGLPFDLPRTFNRWILAQRSLSSFDSALDEGDTRAWRIALDRVRAGEATPEEVDHLLESLLARATTVRTLGMLERSFLMILAQAKEAPADLAERVLEVFATAPLAPPPVQLVARTRGPSDDREVILTAFLDGWPHFPGVESSVRIIEVRDELGAPVAIVDDAPSDSTPPARNAARTQVALRLPTRDGAAPHARVTVEISATRQGSPTPFWRRTRDILLGKVPNDGASE